MNQVENSLETVVKQIESVLNTGLDNIYINTGIKVFLGLYAAFAAPSLPANMVFLMDNIFVRIVVAFVIIFMATRDPSMALIMAIAFIMTLQTANKLRIINTSMSYSEPGESSWLPSAKGNVVDDNTSDDSSSSDSSSNVSDDSDDSDDSEDVRQNTNGSDLVPTQNSILETMESGDPSQLVTTSMPEMVNTTQMPEMVNTTEMPDVTPSLVVNESEHPFFKNVSDQDEANISLSRPSDNLAEPTGEPSGLFASDDVAPLFSGVEFGTNEIPGANQDSSVGTFQNQHSIQGIGHVPEGY